MKKVPKRKLADKIHRGFVNTCIGVSALLALGCVYTAFQYMVEVRPRKKLAFEQRKLELLQEGAAFESDEPHTS